MVNKSLLIICIYIKTGIKERVQNNFTF